MKIFVLLSCFTLSAHAQRHGDTDPLENFFNTLDNALVTTRTAVREASADTEEKIDDYVHQLEDERGHDVVRRVLSAYLDLQKKQGGIFWE